MRWMSITFFALVVLGCSQPETPSSAASNQPPVADPKHEDAQNAPHLVMESVMTAIEGAGVKKAAVNTKDHFIVITGIAPSKEIKVAAAEAAKKHLLEGQELLDEVEVVRS